ncbi:MAG TPA: hypothetical protein PKD53_12635 [Chloroflexaceae bacterium]|nr:hypothetical protein [Chloroflexaceae bacterium]
MSAVVHQDTAGSRQRVSQSQAPRPPHARITAWMIRYLTNAERLVAEGLCCELAVGETRVCTSADIAGWANVSEATVSRALPGLAAKGLLRLRRVIYAETGRPRWEVTRLAAQADGSFVAAVGSDMDVTPQRVNRARGAVFSAPTPKTDHAANSASGRLTFSPDPRIFLDSCMNQLASEPGAPREAGPDPRTPPVPPAPPALAELVDRGVNPALARRILAHDPALDGARFDALLARVRRERPTARNPRALLISLLAAGKQLNADTPDAPADAPAERVSDLPILLTPGVPAEERAAWLRRFRGADGPDAKRAVLARFREAWPPPTAAAG